MAAIVISAAGFWGTALATEFKDPSGAKPFFETWDEDFPGACSMVVAMDGSVLLFKQLMEETKRGHIVVKRSEDGGKTWGPEIEVGKPVKIDGDMSDGGRYRGPEVGWSQLGTTIVDENTGDIMVFASSLKPAQMLYRSKDNGKTWRTENIVIKPDINGWLSSPNAACDPGVTLRYGKERGRLLVPSRVFWEYVNKSLGPEIFAKLYSNAIYSDDGGKTWTPSAPFPLGGTGEAGLAELKDGRIYYNSRTHMRPGNRQIAWSDDGGETWTDQHEDAELFDGPPDVYGCKGGLVRLPYDDRDVLVFSSPSRKDKRWDITVWVSFDVGETWRAKRLVKEGPGGYTWLAAGRKGTPSEGMIYLAAGNDWMARFNLAGIMEGDKPSQAPGFARAGDAPDKVLLDFGEKGVLPEGWEVEGYAFGTCQPNPKELQRAAVASRNQRQYQTGRMISPEFLIDNDYLQVVCSGVFHPTRCAVVLVVDGKDVRSCSPVPGCGFLGFDASPASLPAPVKLGQPPRSGEYWFDLRPLRGKLATIEVRDEHKNGYFSMVKIVASDRRPPADAAVVTEAVCWLPDRHEATINGDFLLLPVGALAGTPLQAVTVEIDGRQALEVDLPLAFGAIPVVGYLPVYDLTGHHGKPLKVSFHSYSGHDPSRPSLKVLMQREIPGREAAADKPAFHIHNRIGLLNDPNGLVYADGVYHVFHQFNYNISSLSWAHYASTDLMHWEERPVALWHDKMGSMFSGSAAVDVLNTSGWRTGDTAPVIAAYTASRGIGSNDKIQMQCVAYSIDGARTFTKFEGNPVIGKLARGPEVDDAGDPKLFWFSPTKGRDPHARDGHWVMVMIEGKSLNIYTSDNLRDWEKHGQIDGFYDCPELFPLAVDENPKDVRWIMYGGRGDYHIGSFDGKRFTPETRDKIPMYHDGGCYAAQTFNNAEPGFGGQPRRIQVAWQGGRLGQLSTPTELTLRTTPLGLRVCKQPVREIAKLRTRTVTLDGAKLTPGAVNPLAGLDGGLYDLELEADLSQADRLVLDIRGVNLIVEASADGLQLGGMTIPGTRKLSLRLIVDNTSLDVYFGEHGVYYSPKMIKPKSKSVSIEAIGGPVPFATLRGHELKGIW